MRPEHTESARIGRTRRPVIGMIAGALLVSSCATAKPAALQVAAPRERVALVVLGGDRARGQGRRGGFPTNWAQQVFRRSLPPQAVMANLSRHGFAAADGPGLDADLARLRPTIAALWVGDDDALRGTPPAAFQAAYVALLDAVHAAGVTRLYAALLPPWPETGLSADRTAPYNAAIRAAVGARSEVHLVDLTTLGAQELDQDAVAAAFISAGLR